MKRTMNRLPEQTLCDEAEMRAFYQSFGIRENTIDAAIKVRRNKPIEQDSELPVRDKTAPAYQRRPTAKDRA